MLPSVFNNRFFNSFLDDPFEDLGVTRRALGSNVSIMKTDIKELDNSYQLAIDLPGYRKEDISAEVKDGYLTVSATKSESDDEKSENGRYLRRERYFGSCSRSFYIGEDITENDIKAKFDNGILTLSFPKQVERELPASRTVAIE